MSEPKKRCSKCGRVKPLSAFHQKASNSDGRQSYCRECRSEYVRQRYQRPGIAERARCREKERRERHRAEMLKHLGGRCALCGESEPLFLTVDHIDGNGNRHRAKVGESHHLWRHILREGCPTNKYRILCFNCNCALNGHSEAEIKMAIQRRMKQQNGTP